MEGSIKHYDYLVVGAGSGGLGSARRAAMFGKKVGMIENKVIGGTCVNVGCVPKKVMFNLASFLEEAQLMADYGVDGTEHLKLDFPTFKIQRDAYIKRLNAIYHTNVKNSGVDYIEGTARFSSTKEVEVTHGETKTKYSADNILIASGCEPEKGKFEGSEHCCVSDNVFEWEVLPKSVVVIGGGYIAVEMAQILHAFGVKTTLVVRDIPLRHVDQEVVDLLVENIKKQGMEVRLKTPFSSVTKDSNSGLLTVNLEDGSNLQGEQVLLAMGRTPKIDLGLEDIGVVLEKGAVKVDEHHNTNIPGIYAIGDVTNLVQLTPVAIKAGRILAERLFNNRTDLIMNYKNIATVIFSHPPIGCVGMTEAQAKREFGEDKVKAYRSKFTNMFYSLAKDDHKKLGTLFKLICHITDDGQEKIVGVHCIGKGVDEMMQVVSVALNMGATKKDFDSSVAIHPTASEEFVLMDPKLY